MYNSGYDPQFASFSVGIASKALVLRDAIESGHTVVDFLRGSEPYKYDLGAQDRTVYKLTLRRR
jgi:CelD/BcsL family acetyltransferase involved in cellulose biosynthesis